MGLFSRRDKKKSKDKSKNKSKKYNFYKIDDKYRTYEELQNGLREKGLESSQLVLAVDYTKSNEWTGKKTFNGRCLHDMTTKNPYQQAIEILGRTLEVFDDDKMIPTFGFGDETTTNVGVFPFKPDNSPCYRFNEVLDRYRIITPQIILSGPTNFAPIINKTIEIVKQTGEYHILVIIADGQVMNKTDTANAIVRASEYPISIVMVGVGDGPWDEMENYDDELPQRKFDNFQFVDFYKIMKKKNIENYEVEFARNALMEIPEQYHAIKELGLLDKVSRSVPNRNPNPNTIITSYPDINNYGNMSNDTPGIRPSSSYGYLPNPSAPGY
jgi:hypothetical protein